MRSTIFALATAPGRAAVAVMRLSGPGTREILVRLGAGPPPARRASLRRLNADDGGVLDEALVLWMPGPNSFTGEDCAELHLHGGPAVVDAVGSRLIDLGAQPAEAGAFTRRAFEAGRIDLVQAEAVADLVDAETEAQRRQALDQLHGSASRQHEAWRARLTSILAGLEAAVDFPDEDIPPEALVRTRADLIELAGELTAAASDRRGERVRDGFRIALLGPPNVGKSSLFNALLERDAAIVADIPGTTRDVIEAELVIAGRRVILADLAGLRESEDVVEREGVRRARAWGETADLRLLLSDGVLVAPAGQGDFLVRTKADLSTSGVGLPVSTHTGDGILALRAEIERRVTRATTGASAPAATRERHRRDLLEAAKLLHEASAENVPPELMSEDARLAGRSLARLTGRIDAEDVLGEVFSTFCIGK